MVSKGASKTLFVGNLHASLEESDLLELFRPFGRIVECCKRWCHYGFIQFALESEAQLAYNGLNGSKLRGRPMRIEFQRKKLRNLQALFEAEGECQLLGMGARVNEHFLAQYGYKSLDGAAFSAAAFSGPNDCESDPFQDNVSSIGSSMDDNHNLENMNRIFDELMSEQAMERHQQLQQTPFAKPLATLDINQKQRWQLLISDQKQQPLFASDHGNEYRKKSESSKKYSQLTKPNSAYTHKTSYLNNTSEFLKSLIQESHCSSPIASKGGVSPKKALSRAIKHCASNLSSVSFFRSINNSHTIMVEPTDVLEPLHEGEFTEYKLFPTRHSSVSHEMEMDVLGDCSPQSLSLSCSNLSSVSSSMVNSPSQGGHGHHVGYLVPDTVF